MTPHRYDRGVSVFRNHEKQKTNHNTVSNESRINMNQHQHGQDYNDYYYDNRMDDDNDSAVYEQQQQQQQLAYPQEELYPPLQQQTTRVDAIRISSSNTEEEDEFFLSSSSSSTWVYDRVSAGVAYLRVHYFAILIAILVVGFRQLKGSN
jgi:hypothetical protein